MFKSNMLCVPRTDVLLFDWIYIIYIYIYTYIYKYVITRLSQLYLANALVSCFTSLEERNWWPCKCSFLHSSHCQNLYGNDFGYPGYPGCPEHHKWAGDKSFARARVCRWYCRGAVRSYVISANVLIQRKCYEPCTFRSEIM